MIPKIRVWNEKLNKVFEVTNYDWTTEVFSIKTGEAFGGVASIEIDPEYYKEPMNFVFMQSTGLKDKNGIEVFEGDILTDEGDFGHNFWDYGRIEFCKYEHSYYIHWKLENVCENITCCSDYSVAGNIYENKELLND